MIFLSSEHGHPNLLIFSKVIDIYFISAVAARGSSRRPVVGSTPGGDHFRETLTISATVPGPGIDPGLLRQWVKSAAARPPSKSSYFSAKIAIMIFLTPNLLTIEYELYCHVVAHELKVCNSYTVEPSDVPNHTPSVPNYTPQVVIYNSIVLFITHLSYL